MDESRSAGIAGPRFLLSCRLSAANKRHWRGRRRRVTGKFPDTAAAGAADGRTRPGRGATTVSGWVHKILNADYQPLRVTVNPSFFDD